MFLPVFLNNGMSPMLSEGCGESGPIHRLPSLPILPESAGHLPGELGRGEELPQSPLSPGDFMPIHVRLGSSGNQLILTEMASPDNFPTPVAVAGRPVVLGPQDGGNRAATPRRRQTIAPPRPVGGPVLGRNPA